MYTKRIQLTNYGPIEQLDIEFPFNGETPKPVVVVGENGSGKSILLSHIVNGLLAAKGLAFSETPEVELGKAYKLRSGSYIRTGSEYYFGRVDFDRALFFSEIRTWRNKQEYSEVPAGISGTAAEVLWGNIDPAKSDHYDSNIISDSKKIKDIFESNCVLYFPFNRFEEPAWLNERNLKAQAQYVDARHLAGHTNRKVIASSPLYENQNWLFNVIYDRAAFEIQTRHVNLPVDNGNATIPLPVFFGYSGDAARTYETVLEMTRKIMRDPNIRFGIGKRSNRAISVMSGEGSNSSQLVPNIFQLSSGETTLLNLFLSILRDFDLCGTPISKAVDIRGIVVVDEIDLHLHAVHQHEVLPELIKMFPNVQYVVTTHSPLFVLGMQREFGEDGFALYRLPQGHQICAEEFSEFGDAYQAFTETITFSNDMRMTIEGAQMPIVFVEGTTDLEYIQKASQLLGHDGLFERIEIRDGRGAPNLRKIWDTSKHIDVFTQNTLLLFDCDNQDVVGDNRGRLFRRLLPIHDENPIKKGIENLFGRSTLERARSYKAAFIDVLGKHTNTKRGETETIPEQWTINKDEKTNLCNWLCDNGTAEDFKHFRVVFELIEELVDLTESDQECAVPQTES
ncbi:MAG: AAA family ATPase [Gemmatimonadota bacterium]|nr:AAA family ATPase [Gemmatimonadota bacterium]